MDEKAENISVVVRFRPLKDTEIEANDEHIIEIKDNNVILEKKQHESHQFSFDRIFKGNSTQEEVYNIVAKNTVIAVVEGYNSTIFAYGPTSSGKTYCMFGENGENGENGEKRGIIPRICEDLFDIVEKKEEVVDASIKCSFLEIYNENIKDLFGKKVETEKSLKIRQNESGETYVQGLVHKAVYAPEEILEFIQTGSKQRSVGATSLNSVSSRSHAVFSLYLSQKLANGSEIFSKMNLIDLAGSENVGKSEVAGISLHEAQQINKSLSCLGNVINALADKSREHIPYRDSKLTYLLHDSLGGNSKTVLIITASPSPICYYETLSTLKFGKRAKNIKNIPVVNKKEANDQKIAELLKIIEELERKCSENTGNTENTENVPNVETKIEENLTITRLEQKILYLEQEMIKKKEVEIMLENFLEKQKELSTTLSQNLYQEQLRNIGLESDLAQYKLFYSAVKDIKTPSVLDMIMRNFAYLFKD